MTLSRSISENQGYLLGKRASLGSKYTMLSGFPDESYEKFSRISTSDQWEGDRFRASHLIGYMTSYVNLPYFADLSTRCILRGALNGVSRRNASTCSPEVAIVPQVKSSAHGPYFLFCCAR